MHIEDKTLTFQQFAASIAKDSWVDLHNPDTVTCKSPTNCDTAFRDVDGNTVDISGYSYYEAKSEEDGKDCLKLKMHGDGPKIEHVSCGDSKNYVCEYGCSRKKLSLM